MIEKFKKLWLLFNRKDKLHYAGLFILMGIGAIMEVVGIGAVPAFIATLAVPEKVRAYPFIDRVLTTFGINTPQQLVIWGAVGLIVIWLIKTLYLIFINYLQIRMTERHRVRIAHLLFSAYLHAPYEFHLGRNTAELLRNVNGETRQIITGVINLALIVILNAMMTLGILVLLISTTPWSGLVAIGVVGGGGMLFLRLVREKMRSYGEKARTERKNSIQAIQQGLGGLQDARILGVENFLIQKFLASISRFARYERFRGFVRNMSTPLLEFIAVAGLMIVVLSMVFIGVGLRDMVPMLGLFGAAIVRLRSSIGAIAANASQLGYNLPSVDAVVDDLLLLKTKHIRKVHVPEINYNRAGNDQILPMNHEIFINNMTYVYPGNDTPALKDINLRIQKGESVGLVGATGSGKTTLVNVLLGLLKPQEGKILADGVDIYSDIRLWQNNLGYIPQSIFLLDDTIRNNIAFGLPEDEIDEDRLWRAIKSAQLEPYILQLPEGVETFVGERGVRMSGGQRQRIGLARAIYRNPDVLVMDEATSALDNETENKVMEALHTFSSNRTLIMIAHRLTTVKDCNRLFFLKDGSVEAEGSYEELKSLHRDFRRMAQV